MKKAIGRDISKYDRTFNPQESMYPLDFIVARAGHSYNGVFYEDPRFVSYFPGIAQVPIKMAYCYLNSVTALNIQVEEFLDTVEKAPFEWDGFVCDWEGSYNTLSESFADKGVQWMEQIKELTGKPVILYTNISLYDTYWSSRGIGYPLWIANFLPDGSWTIETIHNKVPNMPVSRKTWKIWQFSSTIKGTDWGTGREDAGDIDMFNGTLDDMREFLAGGEGETPEIPMDKVLVSAEQLSKVKQDVEAYRLTVNEFLVWVGRLEEMGEKLTADVDTLIRGATNPEVPVEPPPPPPPPPKDLWKTLYGLNVRSTATVADNKVGVVAAGTTVEILKRDNKTNGDIWGKIGTSQWIALKYNGQMLAKEL